MEDDAEQIEEIDPSGVRTVRFNPVAPYMVEPSMEDLHLRLEAAYNAGDAEPLIFIPNYVLDFLCIHPFTDGNGRIARRGEELAKVTTYRFPARLLDSYLAGVRCFDGASSFEYAAFNNSR